MTHKLKVLLVEDDLMLQEVLKSTLEGFGCTVMCSNNGYEAIQLLKKQTFSVIISDIKMPKMDGISLLETLKTLGINTPVVMMTGYSEYKDDQIAHAGGVVLLEKPFTRAKLKELFDEYMSLLPTGS
ncbi:MAG: response regulator [Bdellovibrionota bacterium]